MQNQPKNICASKCLHIYLRRNQKAHGSKKRCIPGDCRSYEERDHRAVSRKPLNVNALAEQFHVTRQAVSLHVKILEECGLISIRQQGRERQCEAKLDGLGEVSAWIAQYKGHWESKLDSLESYLGQNSKK